MEKFNLFESVYLIEFALEWKGSLGGEKLIWTPISAYREKKDALERIKELVVLNKTENSLYRKIYKLQEIALM